MATFGFEKEVDDIEEPKLLPMDWYVHSVAKEPRVLPNGVVREVLGDKPEKSALVELLKENPKAGLTLFVDCTIVSEDEDFNGRESTLMLPYPSTADLDRRSPRSGMKVYDEKMERIVGLCEAAGSEGDGESIDLAVGQEFQALVKQRNRQGGKGLENQPDIFAGFRAVGEAEEEFDLPGDDELDEATGDELHF